MDEQQGTQTLHEASSAALQRSLAKRRKNNGADDNASFVKPVLHGSAASYLPAPNQAPTVPQCGVAAAQPENNYFRSGTPEEHEDPEQSKSTVEAIAAGSARTSNMLSMAKW